jgi:predicted GIY-YIG superfamily endonuclease
MRSPQELEYIRSLDVLLIDELGQVSAEMISALDIIFRRVRNNSAFFGGMLVFASMDSMQLRPVEGRPPLLSPQLTVCFDFFPLDHSVRAAQCPALQRLVQICRLSRPELTESVRKEFVQLIAQSCTFVPDWDDPRLRPDMLRMFATHSARREAESRLMTAVRKRFGSQLVMATSLDHEASVEGNWVEASAATSRLLTKRVKEPRELYFYPRATYEITYNKAGHYAQSQLAVLADVPTLCQARSFEPVRVFVAPEGTKAIPENLVTERDFISAGFRIETVGKAPSRTQYIGLGFQGKRVQYGLRHRIAATIHAGMGQDLPTVITKVDGAEKYRLFQREQVVVLLSRTHFAKDIYFVGEPEATAEVLWDALNMRSAYDSYLEYLMKQLTNRGRASRYEREINLPRFHPCRPIDCGLPQDSSGYVYILASVNRSYIGQATYIGQAENLAKRFRKHLDGSATEQTADPAMRPWMMLAYVSGFEGCSKAGRMFFETLWQGKRDEVAAKRGAPLTADQVADLGRKLVDDRKYSRSIDLHDKELRFHRCGVIRDHPADPKDKP